MRFLHTADWQIGMKAAALGDAGARVREERLAAGKRAIEAAREQGVDFILVAGDTFEDNAVDRVLVQRVADILAAFGSPVFIIPGNHDPLAPGSVWEHPAWKSAAQVRVLREETPVEAAGGRLYPCPVFEKRSNRNPTAWIPDDRGDVIRVGMAHGTVEGVHQEEPDYPIPRDAARQCGLDYLALGHWHSYAAYPDEDGVTRMAYSGTHETTKFGERDSGNTLLVDIDRPGATPRITPVRTAGLTWTQLEEDLREAGALAHLREAVEAMGNGDTTLIEITLAGLLHAQDREELERIRQIVASRFLYGRLNTGTLRPSPEDDAWISNLPPGVVREAALRLRDAAAAGPDETALRALLELYALVEEAAS